WSSRGGLRRGGAARSPRRPPAAAVQYPGPGDYELSAHVSALGRTRHDNGSISKGEVSGAVSVPVTFTSAATGPRLGASIQPDRDGKTLTLTVTNTGKDKAGSIVLQTSDRETAGFAGLAGLQAIKQYRDALAEEDPDEEWIEDAKEEMEKFEVNKAAQTEDPRCASNKQVSECQLGTLDGGASTTLVFKTEYANDLGWTISSPDQVGKPGN
ncbi:hypothetical protein, partial [Nocardia brasiliensis]|uniref:hypothetical protein n=1 Tax=Nocardia brasiliensis TaxID=37326 RepID=UPI002453C15D